MSDASDCIRDESVEEVCDFIRASLNQQADGIEFRYDIANTPQEVLDAIRDREPEILAYEIRDEIKRDEKLVRIFLENDMQWQLQRDTSAPKGTCQ